MKTTGIVIALNGSHATVRCQRSAACDGCHKKENGENCSVCSLMGDNRSMDTVANNTIGAVPGDTVELQTETARVTAYAALVFLLPIVSAIIGYYLGQSLLHFSAGPYMGAGLLFILTFFLIRFYSERLLRNGDDVKIVAILSPNDTK